MKPKFRRSEHISRDDLFSKFCSAVAGRWPEMPALRDLAAVNEEEIDRRMAEVDQQLRAAGAEQDPIEEEFLPELSRMGIHVRTWGELLDLGPDPFDGRRVDNMPGVAQQNARTEVRVSSWWDWRLE